MSLVSMALSRRSHVSKAHAIVKRRVSFKTDATGEVFRTEHVYPRALEETSTGSLFYTQNERRRKQMNTQTEVASCRNINNSFVQAVETLFVSGDSVDDEEIQNLALSVTQHSCRGLERRVSGLFDRRRDCLRQQLLRLQSRLRDENTQPELQSQLLSNISIILSKNARLFAERVAAGDALQNQSDSSGVAKAA
jgi:hypothetical protein